MFFIFSIINFLIFSSYNYILNFIDFNNFFSNNASYQGHRFWGGIQGYIANLIHYIFQSFDFTGFKWGYYLNNKILIFKENIFNLINIDKFTGCNVIQDRINIISDEQISGFGILGFLVFIPSIFYGLFKIFINKNKRTILLFLLSLTFIINILVLSMSLAYMVYSIRFIVSFVTLSFIVLACSYKKRGFFRYIVLFFCLFYMILLSTHIKRAPFFTILKHFKNANYNLEILSENAYRNKVVDTSILGSKIYQTIKEKYADKKKIAFVKNLNSPCLYLKKLGFEGYKIDFLATIDENKIKNYDLIILEDLSQNDNVFNTDSNLIQYKIKNNSVIFNKTNNPDCYFYDIEGNVTADIKEAIERRCFNYDFIKQRAKLDYIELFEPEFLNKLENIYYFLP